MNATMIWGQVVDENVMAIAARIRGLIGSCANPTTQRDDRKNRQLGWRIKIAE